MTVPNKFRLCVVLMSQTVITMPTVITLSLMLPTLYLSLLLLLLLLFLESYSRHVSSPTSQKLSDQTQIWMLVPHMRDLNKLDLRRSVNFVASLPFSQRAALLADGEILRERGAAVG